MDSLPPAVDVYGVGTFGQELADSLVSSGVVVRAFVDGRSPSGPLRSPYVHVDEASWDHPVVIGICNPAVDIVALAQSLLDRGAAEVITPVRAAISLFKESGVLVSNYWLTGDVAIYEREREAIDRARSLLEDEVSRATFDSIINYRRSGDLRALGGIANSPDLYHPAGLGFESDRMRYVDGGSFDGDTVRDLRSRGCDVEALFAFEPDPRSWEATRNELLAWPEVESRCRNEALGIGPGRLQFNASGLASASSDQRGTITVSVVSLDEVAGDWEPTHIKLDVEGAEPEVIEGGRGVLRSARPRLAVSVYHRPEHLWALARQIDELAVGYRFWLRCHGQQTFDTVLYCAPESIEEGVTAA